MDVKRFPRGLLVGVVIAVFLLFFLYRFDSSGTSYKSVDTAQVINLIESGQVKSALLIDTDQTIQITTKTGQTLQASWVGNQGQGLATTLQQQYAKHNLPGGYDVQVPEGGSISPLILSWLPVLLIILLFLFIMNQMQGGGSRVMNFGKSKAKLITKDTPKTTFADVAGADEAIEELQEIKEFLQSPGKFQAIGAKIPKGVLLYGPPGTGKTLLARAVAGEAGVPFYSISGSDFVEMFVGVGASRVRDLFEQAKANAPAIVFVDEIDAVGRHRGAGFGGGHDEREQTLNQLLVELDGFETKGGVIVIAATNRPDILDPALLRPGRFDRQIVGAQPDLAGRKGILRVHARGKPVAHDVERDIIARRPPGVPRARLAAQRGEVARGVIAGCGVSARLGASKFGNADGEPFIGREMSHSRDYSEEIASAIDDEVRRLIESAHDEAWEILVQYRDVLDNLVLQLMEHETLSRNQVLEIFSPIRQRATRGSYTGYGKRLPSDRPPVLTPKEMALTAAADGSEQPGAGNGQAAAAGRHASPQPP